MLIVDDEALFRMTLADSVRSRLHDVDVVEAADGHEAAAVLDRQPIHAVVTDLRMPGMDGIGLLAELLRRRSIASALVVSAHTIESLPADGLLWFVTKPVDPFVLCGHIEQLLRESGEHARGRVTRMGLVQAIASERWSCIVREAGAGGGGALGIVRGELKMAWAVRGPGTAGDGPLRGVAAAVEILSRDGAVDIEHGATVEPADEDPDLDLPLRHVLARVAVRRRSRREGWRDGDAVGG